MSWPYWSPFRFGFPPGRPVLAEQAVRGLNLGMVLIVSASKPESQQTQKTRPKKGEPIDIPVPKRGTIDKLLRKAAQPLPRRSGK